MTDRIAKNYIYTIIYKVLSILAPLITTPYIARTLHSDGVGIYSYTYSIATAFALFAALGINTYGQREIAYRQSNEEERIKAFNEIFQFRLIMTIGVSILYFVFCIFYEDYKTPLLFQSAIILSTMFDISWYFQGIEDFKTVVIRNLVIKFATIALIFLFVKTRADVNKYILLNSLSIIVSNAIFFFKLRIPILKFKVSSESLKKHLRGAITFFVPLIAVEIYSHLDKIMLGALVGNDFENGYYEQARKITQLVVTIITSVNVVMMPRISNLYALNDKKRIKGYFEKSLRVIFLVMLPCVVGLFFVSDQFVLWFFGSDFSKVSALLKICCIMVPFMGIGNFVGMQFLTPTNQQNKMTKAYIIAAVTNMALNMLLIPKLLSVGALIASVVAEVVSCSIQLYYFKNSDFNTCIFKGIWKYVFAVLVMYIGLFFLDHIFQLSGLKHTLISVMVGGAIYGLTLILLNEEILSSVLRRVIRK